MSADPTRPCELSRREFCAHACQAASLIVLGSLVLIVLGSLVQSCGGGGGSPTAPSGGGSVPQLASVNATVANGMAMVTVEGSSPLANVGGAALVQTSARDLLVARTGQDAFTALTAVCTHEACTITGFQSSAFVCPCHGSRFDTSGAVINGPATRGLQTFPTQLAGTTLSITL